MLRSSLLLMTTSQPTTVPSLCDKVLATQRPTSAAAASEQLFDIVNRLGSELTARHDLLNVAVLRENDLEAALQQREHEHAAMEAQLR